AGLAGATTPADPVGIGVGVGTDVNGDGFNDIVVADQGTGQIGELLNTGTGTFGATAPYTSGDTPAGVALGDFIPGHTKTSILDAATSNGASSGDVYLLTNGNPATTDGNGNFGTLPPLALPAVPGGKAETAIVTADLDSNGVADLVAADP